MQLEPFVASTGGSDALFYPLVFFHVVTALAGFGSLGFAGTYAGRAAQLGAAGEGAAGLGGAGRAGRERVGEGGAPGEPPAGAKGAPGGRAAPSGPGGQAEQGAGRAVPDAPSVTADQDVVAAAGRPDAPTAPADPEMEELVRYFGRPARFWKAVLAVPVFGVVALAVEPGGGGLDQVWDLAALLVWGCAALVAAGVVVPSLREVRSAFEGYGKGQTARAGSSGERGHQATPAGHDWLGPNVRARLTRYGRLASRGAAVCDVLFFVALALMIWRP